MRMLQPLQWEWRLRSIWKEGQERSMIVASSVYERTRLMLEKTTHGMHHSNASPGIMAGKTGRNLMNSVDMSKAMVHDVTGMVHGL